MRTIKNDRVKATVELKLNDLVLSIVNFKSNLDEWNKKINAES